MTAFPTESELFPTGDLDPATAKARFRQWLQATVGLLGTSGNASDARALLGVPSIAELAGFRNRLINGSMAIDQRTVGAAIPNSNGFVVDMWSCAKVGSGAYTSQRVTDAPPGFTHSAKMTVTTASASPAAGEIYQIFQAIFAPNVADLAFGTSSAKPIAVSFWVKCSIPGEYAVSVLGGVSLTRSYVAPYTINQPNTWEYKSVTIPGDNGGAWTISSAAGMILVFDLGSGANYVAPAPSVWQSAPYRRVAGTTQLIKTNGATFQLTGVQLEVGTKATPFEFRHNELQLAQAYCWRWNGFMAAAVQNAAGAEVPCQFPVQMVVPPSFSNMGNGTLVDGAGSYAVTSMTASGITTMGARLQVGASGTTPGRGALLVSHDLIFSAAI